jgi:L-alanine-DL-glutamate epimerase-like enolase superfamily enzyme
MIGAGALGSAVGEVAVAADAASRLAAVRITEVEAIPFALPYRRAPRFASGSVDRADNVLVRVHTDAGVTGQSEAQPRPYTYGETQASITAAVRGWFAPRLLGLPAGAIEQARAACAGLAGNHCAQGAVDLALWDLFGLLVGMPCSTLLGGFADRVAVAHMVSFDTPEAMAADALAMHEEHGVRAFKVKVGRDPDLDVAAMRAVRDALPDADLYADANRGWSLPDALRAGDALSALGVTAIEEPIAIDDVRGRALLAARWDLPLAGDESCLSVADVRRAIAEGAVGQVSLKAARTGFSASRDVLALCRAHRLGALVGSQYEGGLGTLASIHLAAAYPELAARPVEAANFLDLAADLLAEPPRIEDGHVRVPTGPGLGALVDEDVLAAHRLEV